MTERDTEKPQSKASSRLQDQQYTERFKLDSKRQPSSKNKVVFVSKSNSKKDLVGIDQYLK
jgi:hypothetical protein